MHSYTLPTESIGPSFRFDPDQWLWCLHCCRFFQGRDARPDGVGGVQGCAFEDCSGAGYGIDIHDWALWGQMDTDSPLPGWPARSELTKGLRVDGLELLGDDDDEIGLRWRDEHGRLGIGAALNQDAARRDELLGITQDCYCSDVAWLEDLDVAQIETLAREQFLPEFNGERAPSTSGILRFLHRWPEARAHGYAVHVSRDDYRITIAGLGCDLSRIAREDRETFCAEFTRTFGDVDSVTEWEEYVNANWD